MKKLSKIDESAWGDMMRRGSGESIRTEDDVNLLDVDGLTAYLRKNYRIDDPLTITRLIGNGGCIYVSLYEDTDGYDYILMYEHIDNGDKKLYLSGGVKEVSEDIFNEMKNKYKVTVLNDYDPDGHPLGNIMVEPNDGRNITNKFFIEFLDFIIERIEKPLTKKIYKKSINESAWGDMMRRGSGEEIRTEDDINHLDYEEFFVYLTEHYKPKSKKTDDGIGGRTSIIDTDIIEIFIPIESINGIIKTLMIEMDKKDNHIVSMSTTPTMLSNNYTLDTPFAVLRLSSKIYIKPKKKPTNRTVVDLIDTFLAVVDNPILEKVS